MEDLTMNTEKIWTLELTPPHGEAMKLNGVSHESMFDILRTMMYGDPTLGRHAAAELLAA
jgi:hypothetical protein